MIKKVLKKIYLKKKGLKGFSGGVVIKWFKNDYKNKYKSLIETMKIHKRGFSVTDWCFFGLDNSNYKDYLSSVKYIKMHPINGEYTKWIDDKLTLKYILSKTELDKCMPEYYFQIDAKGNLLKLMDLEQDNTSARDALNVLLKQRKELAIKRISGSVGEGFYKAEYTEGFFYMNGKKLNEEEFNQLIASLKNYLIIEYLKPHKELAKFCPNTANSIRYLAGRIDGKMEMIKSFIRFGTKDSGFVENYNAGGVLCYINKNGEFTYGNIINREKVSNEIICEHPDSNEALNSNIPLWNEIETIIDLLDKLFPQMKYLGVDFVVTSENEVKMLEINSLTSLDTIQLDCSILKTEAGKLFFDSVQR